MDAKDSESKFRKKTLSTIQAKRLVGMLISSFNDYTASRVLFMTHCFPEACNYGCSSIEKFFKALLLFDNINPQKDHDISKIFNQIERINPSLAEKLSSEFLQALYIIYKFRYIGDQMIGYNFTIVGKKFLAELHYTYATLDPHLRFGWKKYGNNGNSMLEQHIEMQDKRICNFNYLALKKPRDEFVTSYDWIYEARMVPNGELLQVLYPTDDSKNDRKFIYEALIIGEDRRSAQHPHKLVHPYELQRNYKEIMEKLLMNGM